MADLELVPLLPPLAVMLVLMACSSFFSASEAAFFYLRERDLRQLSRGNLRQGQVVEMLASPDRLLSGILFWNLVLNLATFALTSIVSLRLETMGSPTAAVGFAAASLVAVIFFAEMLPKSVAVLKPRWFAECSVTLLRPALRLVDPLLPLLNGVNRLSLRLLWPSFKPEPYLELVDLERAIQMSGADATLNQMEQRTLENIVSLSDQRVDEWMRPSGSFPIFSPPVTLEQIRQRSFSGSYVLISEPAGDEVEKSLWLAGLTSFKQQRIDLLADPVIYVPWCTTVASVIEKLARSNLQVAAIVNEHGQTIGVATLDDILDTIFTTRELGDQEQSLADQPSIRPVSERQWVVTGVTSLRLLGRALNLSLPESRNVTVRGVIQEALQRLAKQGDRCRWGPVEFTVIEAPQRGRMQVLVRQLDPEEK